MMKCALCGKELAPGVKFCPNCGTQVVEQTPEAVPNAAQTAAVPEQTANPYVSQTASQQNANPYVNQTAPQQNANPYVSQTAPQQNANPYASQTAPQQNANPYVNQTAPQQNANPYYGNIPPYDPTLSPYAGMGVPQKKKKAWPWVLLACLIVFGGFVLLCVIAGILVGRLVSKDLEICNTATDAAYAVLYADGESYCEALPESFLTYLEDTYGVERDELEDSLSDYLETGRMVYKETDEIPAAYGMDWMRSYWATDDVFYSHDMPDDLVTRCESVLGTYGIEGDAFSVVTFDESDEAVTDEALSAVQIDDSWYIVDLMMAAEELCRVSCGENALMRVQAEQYLRAVTNRDSEALAGMVPDAFWSYLQRTYTDFDSTQWDAILSDYIENAFGIGEITNFTCETADPVWYDSASVSSFNEAYDYGLDYAYCVDYTCSYSLRDDYGDLEDNYTVTFVEIDGEWYIVDPMIDYDYACYDALWEDASSAETDDTVTAEDSSDAETGGDTATDTTVELPDKTMTKLMDDYFAAYEDKSAVGISALVPDAFWPMLDDYYGMSQSEAEGCMTAYLLDLQASYDEKGVTYEYTVTDAYDYSNAEAATLNEYFEAYQLDSDTYTEVWIDLTVRDSNGGTLLTEQSWLTFGKIDGTWYLFDAMTDYMNASELYADAAGSDM